jgi:glycosyltransferase involved in cell wall biosynthesis
MKKPEQTYWVDLSDLSKWSGHHTGIQRVVFNLAKYYAKRSDVKFFVFDKPATGFFEVDFNIIKNPPEVLDDVSPEDSNHPKRHIVRRMAYAIPARYRRKVPDSVKSLLRFSYQAARSAKNRKHSNRVGDNNFNLDKKAIFGEEDIILILGSPWANPAMMPVLVNAKLQIGFKLIQVIYDVIPVLMPYLFGQQLFPEFTRYLFDVVTSSDGLVAISESSKKDVESFRDRLLVTKKPVGVIRLGDELTKTIGKKPKINIQPGKFILCVGTFEIRKNYQLLYYAYKEAEQRDISLPKLVIVGRKGWLTDDLSYVIHNDESVKDIIFTIHNGSDSNLSWLYENCRFVVYPAIYEGWGLPIAESLAYGKFCIAANTSSMTEISPSLVEHFSPYDSSACLDLLYKYSSNDKILNEKETKIKQEYGKYTWESSYQQFDKFVSQVLKSDNAN